MSQGTCENCALPLKPEDKFCGTCGAPVGAAADPVATPAVDLPTPAALTGRSSSFSLGALKQWVGSLNKRTLIFAGAGIAALAVVVALGIGIGTSIRSSQPSAASQAQEGDSGTVDQGDSAAEATPSPTPEKTSAPVVIIPHYSPDPGSFVPADPARFVLSGFDGANFISPSANLGCTISSDPHGLWGCVALEHHWAFESDTSDDYCYNSVGPCGDGIVAMGAEPTHPRMSQVSPFPADTVLSNGGAGIAVLQYGESLTLGSVTCYSESLGVSCQSAVSGHGFTIARDRNDVY
ncbi:MAG: hypothetical protein KF761_13985 [Salinibacterium sp.]|nr:hypothetical protein [Salinibacterium sp.]